MFQHSVCDLSVKYNRKIKYSTFIKARWMLLKNRGIKGYLLNLHFKKKTNYHKKVNMNYYLCSDLNGRLWFLENLLSPHLKIYKVDSCQILQVHAK